MFNKVIMVGNLTRDVELRYLPSGSAVATIGLASNRRYKKQDGSQAEEVCFIDVKLFGRTAEVANQYLRKGSKILIEGKLTYESWTDQSGAKRSRHVITAESMQMMDTRSDSQSAPQAYEAYPQYEQQASYAPQMQRAPQQASPQSNYSNSHNIPEINIDDDEIPF
ncbi:single-stranded DNA-binding protein [Helicobacter kayseriensis]|uniref:single-stranded DNA-binding protein n=1 Tax=Helicobacter kayseriensis TaxID=2905877 RepID=UPI001E5A59C4|nr:single-stranded DNA-binding protein [Helicobacter kayseriensis]MCE3047220.1 single-stranded DNA-binding protein [Helicobacter kayseriensis]MCE3048591.1 single-stranded DNA-binding protein [Helicobacter kayseriensis]